MSQPNRSIWGRCKLAWRAFNTPRRRVSIPLNTGTESVKPGKSAVITGRAIEAFDLEALFLSNTPAARHEWHIHDIAVNGHSKLGSAGTLPGDMFDGDHTASSHVAYGRINANDEVQLIVSYVGDEPKGQQLYGSLLGTEADDNPITMLADIARSFIRGPSLRYSAKIVRSLLWDVGKVTKVDEPTDRAAH